MSRHGIEIFDTTLQETHHWLKVVMGNLDIDNRRIAFTALRATLHVLRDRIGSTNAVHLGAQLPMLLRGAYYEGWRPTGTPTHERHLEDFLFHIDANLPRNTEISAERAARASFGAMMECLDACEVEKLIQLLPKEIRLLWPNYQDEFELAPAL
ncbi:MAG TPA: DUF2267 domain-containing protein [Micropepsaceae bacterium]|nr:DUF2267 domain-containing protein [Micropepsaceae bacterium]